MEDIGRFPDGSGSRPTGRAASVSPVPASIPNAAPWWRCIHCGCDEFEEHVFTGHMKGVPMIHCANCQVLHSVPNPDSKRALRWQISELVEVLSAAILEHDAGRISLATAREMRAVLASAIEAQRAATENTGAVHESAVGNAETPNPDLGATQP